MTWNHLTKKYKDKRNTEWTTRMRACFSALSPLTLMTYFLLAGMHTNLKLPLWFSGLYRLFQKSALNRMKWISWWRRSLWGTGPHFLFTGNDRPNASFFTHVQDSKCLSHWMYNQSCEILCLRDSTTELETDSTIKIMYKENSLCASANEAIRNKNIQSCTCRIYQHLMSLFELIKAHERQISEYEICLQRFVFFSGNCYHIICWWSV